MLPVHPRRAVRPVSGVFRVYLLRVARAEFVLRAVFDALFARSKSVVSPAFITFFMQTPPQLN